MRLIALIALWFASALPAVAEAWTARLPPDSHYIAGVAETPMPAVQIYCAAKTVQLAPITQSRWFEVSIAPPWQVVIGFTPALIPVPQTQNVEVTLFVDETGYRLPPVGFNELDGGWETQLALSDPMFIALAQAKRLVMQVGPSTAWELPVAGMSEALATITSACGKAWVDTGHPAPSSLTGAVPMDLVPQARRAVALTCGQDIFAIGPHGLKSANIDGDGVPDVILDYNDITCGPRALRPNVCGASTCSIDVFLSRTFAATGRPENLLGTSAATVPLSNGAVAVSASGNFSMCQSTASCAFLFYWDGTSFKELRN